jgi:hypothetical protein
MNLYILIDRISLIHSSVTPKITKLYPLGFQVFFEMENPKYPENMPQYAPMVYLRRGNPPHHHFLGFPSLRTDPMLRVPRGLLHPQRITTMAGVASVA